ncbi:hypothetical protein BGX38DRAFT_1281240 [Terfezia claveryi]|nr:hypothetical protein BGX38DRAFT_1281240 [Terfezia claveryi]
MKWLNLQDGKAYMRACAPAHAAARAFGCSNNKKAAEKYYPSELESELEHKSGQELVDPEPEPEPEPESEAANDLVGGDEDGEDSAGGEEDREDSASGDRDGDESG